MARVVLELYDALTKLGLPPDQARETAKAVSDVDTVSRIEVRAQSLFLAALTVAVAAMVWQIVSINRELGTISANTARIAEQIRDQGEQLHALTEAVTRR